MAGLTQPPGFGDTEWAEDRWARARSMSGPRHLVEGPVAWQPSPVSNVDRTVRVAAGGATVGNGAVFDFTTGAGDTVLFEANSTNAVRYDLLVARWDWNTKTRTFVALRGSTVPPLVNLTTSPVTAQVNRIPGVLYDGAVALVLVRPNVAAFSPDDITDLRLWMQGNDIRCASTYLGFADLGANSEIVTPVGRTVFNSAGSGQNILQARSSGRRWEWGAAGYSWGTNFGNWSKAPASEGKFYGVAGHSYLVESRFTFGPQIPGNGHRWRASLQASQVATVDNSFYGFILDEIEGVTSNMEAVRVGDQLYVVSSGDVYLATMFATSGPCKVEHAFTSPMTRVVDLGPTPPAYRGGNGRELPNGFN